MGKDNMKGQQVFVLPEGASRILGRDAQRTNIMIGYAVANTIRTSLGPKGMDKMLVSDLGDIVITNDGATILDEMNVEHPAAKIMVDIAKTQDKEVGDGTTSSVLVAGYLLKHAGDLLDQNIHPSTITKGFTMAATRCEELLHNISNKVTPTDKETLMKIAQISMESKGVGLGNSKKYLANLIVNAITLVTDENETGKNSIDTELIKIEKKAGESVKESTLVKGVVIDKEFVHSGMNKSLENAKIALIDCPLEVEKTETEAKINITSPDQLESFIAQEEKMIKEMVRKIKDSGTNILFCQKGIDDLAQHYLAKEGISAVRRVKRSDMNKLARATHGKIVSTLDSLTSEDLGQAGKVIEKRVSGDSMIFVEDCKDAKSVTLFLRASTEHVVAEVERAMVDAIGAVTSTVEDGEYVIGGGATEIELAHKLREYAVEVGGREQLAIQSFADALEIIPRTLAESTGMDAIDTLVGLRTKHKSSEGINLGVDVHNTKISNMLEIGVIEPTRVKKQAIASATEAANMILRIDDIISSKGSGGGKPPMPPGGPGGMGGMGMPPM